MSDLLVLMEGIDKSFPGVHALQQCRFELRPGEVHALVCERLRVKTRNSVATTSTMAAPRTIAVCGSSIGAFGVPGRSGSVGGRGEGPSHGESTRSSFTVIRSCGPGSHVLGLERRIVPEEPTGGNPHGGICEGRGSASTTANLHGHAAGNGGYGQGKPTVFVRFSPTRRTG